MLRSFRTVLCRSRCLPLQRLPSCAFANSFRPLSVSSSVFKYNFDGIDQEEFGANLLRPKWEEKELATINKELFQPSEITDSRSESEIDQFREENRITIVKASTNKIPNPVLDFSEVGFPEKIMSCLQKSGFDKPMPIQAQGWPIALSGMDMIAIGETGSGKTLGFILPALVHITEQQKTRGFSRGPSALVVAPTRELAQQIEKVAVKFGSASGVHTVCVYGGASKRFQMNQLSRNPGLVVATPGRLIDILECGGISLENCSFLVLDEADRMLDMGFEPQIRKILEQAHPGKQMQMWSATWPNEVKSLARDFLGQEFVHLNIGSVGLQANHRIEQTFEVLQREDKINCFLDIMKDLPTDEKVLVFCATKRTVDFLDNLLYKRGIRSVGIHGDKTQRGRDDALYKFRSNKYNIMIATDVASRGLDVNDIKIVVNYDFPTNIEDYIHRIGRTARSGKSGKSVSLLVASEMTQSLTKDLIKVLKDAEQEIPEEIQDLRSFAEERKRVQRRNNQYQNDRFSHYSRDRYGARPGFNREFIKKDDRYKSGQSYEDY